jgi:hypothetical protein
MGGAPRHGDPAIGKSQLARDELDISFQELRIINHSPLS